MHLKWGEDADLEANTKILSINKAFMNNFPKFYHKTTIDSISDKFTLSLFV